MTRGRVELVKGPAVGDPVVVDGTKYRIRAILNGTAELAAKGVPDHPLVPTAAMAWDRPVRLWRLPTPLLPETPAPAPPLQPADLSGTCAEHRERLLTVAEYGRLQGWVVDRWRHPSDGPAIICPDPGHGKPVARWGTGTPTDPPVAARRCAWCGEQLYPADTKQWDVKETRAYDSDLHRLHAFRYRRRNERAAAAK